MAVFYFAIKKGGDPNGNERQKAETYSSQAP